MAVPPVLRQGHVLEDEQVVFADQVMTVEHPTLQLLLQAAPPLTFEKSPLRQPAPAPATGQDDAEAAGGRAPASLASGLRTAG